MKPYISPLHTTASSPRVKGCMPDGVSPIMERRWNPMIPLPFLMILVASGPRDTVALNASLNLSIEIPLPVSTIIEHIDYLTLNNRSP